MTPQLRFPEFTDEWQAKKLGDIAVKVSDRNNATSASTVLTNSAVHGVIPQTDFFDKEIAVQGNLSNYYKTELDDFVYNPRISTSAPVGPFKRNNYGSGVLSPLYNLYRFRGGQVLTFFEQYLKSIHWHKYMKDVANYGARSDRMAISSADLLALPLPYPSKPEQEKIADFLTAVDERIAVGEKKLELLEAYKRGVMQKIFSQQIRFKDENGNPYPDWEEKKLGEVFNCVKGAGLSREQITDTGLNKCILYGELYTKYGEVIENVISRTNSNAGISSKSNDLLLPCSTTTTGIDLANATALNEADVQLGGDISILRFKKSGSNIFYAYYLSHFMKQKLASYGQGSTIVHMYFSHYKNMIVVEPSIDEQQKIANFLTTLDDKITAEKSKLIAAKQFKKALLQRMFV